MPRDFPSNLQNKESIVPEIKKILIPTDFSSYSQFALQYAATLAENFSAKLYVMHVCEHLIAGVESEAYHFSVAEFPAEVERNEKERLRQMTEELRSKGIDAESVIRVGRPYSAIVNTAKELEVDLVALATHGRSGPSHVAFGSTAEKVVRLAPCPVLTVKHPE